MKSFHNDVIPVTIGSHLGDAILQLINLTIVIPAVITTNTITSVTDKADVNLNESATKNEKRQKNKNCNISQLQVLLEPSCLVPILYIKQQLFTTKRKAWTKVRKTN